MLGWILLGIVVCAAIATFVAQLRAGELRGQIAAILLGAGGTLLIAFFALPWVSVNINTDLVATLAKSLIPQDVIDRLESAGVLQILQQVIAQQSMITGWSLTVAIPTVSTWMQFSLFTAPATASIAVVVAFAALRGSPASRPAGIFLLVLACLSGGLLFLSLPRIRTLGVDLGIFTAVLDLLPISLGPGVWLTFAGLAASTVAGLLLAQQPTTANIRRRNIARVRSKGPVRGSRSHTHR